MRIRKPFLALFLLLAFVSGQTVNNIRSSYASLQQAAFAHRYHGVGVIRLVTDSPYIERSIAFWKHETQRRFTNPQLIVGHGNTFNGVWCIRDERNGVFAIRPVREVVLEAQKANPGRVIVMICCNPMGERLNMPGVFHAVDSVWFTPDKEITGPSVEKDEQNAREQERGIVGNIFEFVDD
jgi:hypothetical protein